MWKRSEEIHRCENGSRWVGDFLSIHVVDLSISLLPLSLSLPSSQLHISLSLFSRLILSQCLTDYLTYWDFLAAASFTPWSRESARERVCVASRETPSPQHKIFPPLFSLLVVLTMAIFKKQSLKTGNASRTKASELTLRQSICTTQHLTQRT